MNFTNWVLYHVCSFKSEVVKDRSDHYIHCIVVTLKRQEGPPPTRNWVQMLRHNTTHAPRGYGKVYYVFEVSGETGHSPKEGAPWLSYQLSQMGGRNSKNEGRSITA